MALLVTKLNPPVRHEQTVERPRLMQSLTARPGVRLNLVAAPAGFGKTTLLALWAAVQSAESPVGWVSLDERDNDPVTLWLHILAAIQRVCPELSAVPPPDIVGVAGISAVLLPRLVNELAGEGEITLILDDFHVLSTGPARESLAWLIEHAPPTLHIVVASRTEPGLPLARLRAHGELDELRAVDLDFTSDEADVLLNDRLGLSLDRHDVDELVARTEGWPAGLYLAALSLRGSMDRHDFVTKFGGKHRHVHDFLIPEVLEAHDARLQELMLGCSVLDRMSGPLCDAVLDQQGSADLLGTLSRTNLFLIPLDEQGEWYRFHHLFAQLLRAELEHRHPGMAISLHRRAFEWYRERCLADEAVNHALRAGAFAEAGEVICSKWIELTNACRYTTVLKWLRELPRVFVDSDSRLLMVEAWVLSLLADREGAAQAIAKVESLGHLYKGSLPDGFSSIEASLATLRASIPWGDVGSGLSNAIRADQLEPPESPWRPLVCWALGMGHYYSGQYDEADPRFKEAAERAPDFQQWLVGASSLAYRSLIAGMRGEQSEQGRLAKSAIALVDDRSIGDIDGEAFLAMGEYLAACGELDDARPELERAVKVLRDFGQPLDLAYALIIQASLLRALGERDAAAAAAAEAAALVGDCPDPGILTQRLAALQRPIPRPRPVGADLSDRELAVLRLLAGSLSEREIARELYVSHNTIHTHTKSIFHKLDVSSRAEAVAKARVLGLFGGKTRRSS